MGKIDWIRGFYHILFWFTYLLLNGIVVCVMEGWVIHEKLTYAVYREMFSLPAKLALTYFIFYYVIPLYLDRTKLQKLIVATILGFVIATILYRFLLIFIFKYVEPRPYTVFGLQGTILTVFDLYITMTSAVIVKMIKIRYKSQETEELLIHEKLQSELNFLRAQTNPHFLFNTLNNLYGLARKKSEKTAEAIMRLSKIMRFVLYDCRAPRIALADETKIIQDYIELEKLRYNDRLSVNFEEQIDEPLSPIAPLLLLPFIENSFKHGANTTTGNVKINARLILEKRKLRFEVTNTADTDAADNGIATHGIGLRNVQRQLDLIYAERHQLDIRRNDDLFIVVLDVDLNEM